MILESVSLAVNVVSRTSEFFKKLFAKRKAVNKAHTAEERMKLLAIDM